MKLLKLDPTLFNRAFLQISLVDEGKVRPIRSMAGQTVELRDEETGDTTSIQFTDNPMLRMVEATRMVFPDPKEGMAACTRLFRLFELLGTNKEALHACVLEKEGQVLIHASLIKAMAEVEMDSEGDVPLSQLLQLTRKHITEEA